MKFQNDGKGYSTSRAFAAFMKPAFQMSYEEDILIRSTFNCKMSDVAQNDSTKRIALSPKQQKL